MDKKALKRDLLVYLIVFGVLTLPFIFTDLDIWLEKPFYNAANGWFLEKVPFWDFIYKYAIFLGYFLVVVALVVMSVSYWNKVMAKWRRPAFFLLFVMIIGPGVLVNATFKDHWGHPRPREIQEFGGKDQHVKVWVKGPGKGKSFPCGHASMGFFMAIPFLFLRKRYKTWAWIFFIFGTLYGLLIGFTRMLAGGHFASDVLWAAGMVWLVAIPAFYWLNVEKEVDITDFDTPVQRKKRRLATILMGVVLPVLTISLLLATPYISHREFKIDAADIKASATQKINVNFKEGIVDMGFGDDFSLDFKVNAFGFPNSKIGWKWEPGTESNFTLTEMGWFTEIRNEINLQFPQVKNLNLKVGEGEVFLNIPQDTTVRFINIEIEKGDVTLYLAESDTLNLQISAPNIDNQLKNDLNSYKHGCFNLDIKIKDQGILKIIPRQ